MLKRILLTTSFIAGAFIFSACTGNQPVAKEINITEGVHYTVLDTPVKSNPNEVIEFFWYGCPHCNVAEPHIKAWEEKNKGKYVLTQKHSQLSKGWIFDASIFYSLESLGREKEIHKAYFDARQNNEINNEADLVAFLAKYNLTTKELDDAGKSQQAIENRAAASNIEQLAKITGVPAFIVGGKYILKLEGLSSVGGWEGIDKVLNYLLDKSIAEK